MVDISLATPKPSFPRFRSLHIREQLLLQVVIISLIAFSVSAFAIWGLYRTGLLFKEMRTSLSPARVTLQLAKELDHIYGLTEAYQLSYNQEEQRQAILVQIKQSKMNIDGYRESFVSRGENFPAATGSFLRVLDDSLERANQFKPLFDERRRITDQAQDYETQAVKYFLQRVSIETMPERSRRLTEIIVGIHQVHNVIIGISTPQPAQIAKEYADSLSRQLEQVADNQQQMLGVLKDARDHLMVEAHNNLKKQSDQFYSAMTSLKQILADPGGLSDEDAAELRRVITEFEDLFGDPQKPADARTFLGNTLLRSELMSGFRLNSIAQYALASQLSENAEKIIGFTAERANNAVNDADKTLRRALSAAAVGFAVSIGLIIVFVILVIDHNILRRLNSITQKMRALARGETIVITGADKSDELGEMARALQVFWKAELERREFQHKLELANRELQREVDESIYVAQRIQNALLRGRMSPGPGVSDQALLSRPCKLLGGDSYWLERFDDGYVVALIDCTGHGVPGAMMTIVTSIYVSAILHQEGLRDPAAILRRLADHVQRSLLDKSDDVKFDAGFDGTVCVVDLKSQRLCYAGGGIPLIVLDSNSGEIRILKGDGFGIDRASFDAGPSIATREVELRPGMRFYLASDGLVTQPDGLCGVGFGWTRLVKLLRETRHLSLTAQNERVWSSFREFSANAEQRDDVTVIAFAA